MLLSELSVFKNTVLLGTRFSPQLRFGSCGMIYWEDFTEGFAGTGHAVGDSHRRVVLGRGT